MLSWPWGMDFMSYYYDQNKQNVSYCQRKAVAPTINKKGTWSLFEMSYTDSALTAEVSQWNVGALAVTQGNTREDWDLWNHNHTEHTES